MWLSIPVNLSSNPCWGRSHFGTNCLSLVVHAVGSSTTQGANITVRTRLSGRPVLTRTREVLDYISVTADVQCLRRSGRRNSDRLGHRAGPGPSRQPHRSSPTPDEPASAIRLFSTQ